ncbi:IS66 family transposase [Thalassobacter stenotrophicus]|uniref:IS66 family transposase n=1 Tax=Thalassobacter stenotrophicus TaxID=266809 RepID=UPI0022A9C790|nr:transposase [Thalassobacter stenotrophicus]UYP69191.1 IS66 family transposase [Thalassobacter stenotrophicus]
MPLYQQSGIFDRDGLDIECATLTDWIGKSAALLEPLTEPIGRHVLAGDVIFAYAESVKMMASGTGKDHNRAIAGIGVR